MALDPAKVRAALARRPADPSSEADYFEDASPDGRFAVVFSHGVELTMMNWRFWPTLFRADGTALSALEPVQTVDQTCEWAKGPARFVLHATVGPEGFLVVDADRLEWCAVGAKRGARASFDGPDRLKVAFDPDQLKAINSTETFGAGAAQVPVRRFKAPPPDLVRLKGWRPLAALENLDDAFEERVAETDPLPDGWHPFKGKPPASTTKRFNGRPFELHHLFDFAEWGDPQSKAWLDEIVRMADGKPLNKWDKVQKYLGKRVRSAP